MPEIKKHDAARGTIKVVKESAAVGERMKGAYIKTKDTATEDAADRFMDGADSLTGISIHQFDHWGRRGVHETGKNIIKTKDYMANRGERLGDAPWRKKKQSEIRRDIQPRRYAADQKKTVVINADRNNKNVGSTAQMTGQPAGKTVYSAKSTFNETMQNVKTAIKRTETATNATQKTSFVAVKAAKVTAQKSKAAAKATAADAKMVAKSVITYVKLVAEGTKVLLAAIAGGAWISVVIVMMICLVGIFVSSSFGIFFSGEDTGNGQSMQTVVREINKEYEERIESIKTGSAYDVLKMSGSRIEWPEILSIYAIRIASDSENAQELVSMDESKKTILKEIFWKMNEISFHTETVTETVIEESDDGNGNIMETENTVTRTYLYITVTHKSAEEMVAEYNFTEEQQKQLYELLADDNDVLWAAALYGIHSGDGQIVAVALSQVGNIGGEKYWSWYGFDSHVSWCACFVSWCANECGYIEEGSFPCFSLCEDGIQWFKEKGRWVEGGTEPLPGMIIFFDWDKASTGGQDGISDHVGIVERVEDGMVFTVEGNSGDRCKKKCYNLDASVIMGYGM